jgi:hypothetical protein
MPGCPLPPTIRGRRRGRPPRPGASGRSQVPAGNARLIDVCLGDTRTVEGSADRGRRPLASGSPRLTGPQPDVSVKGVQGLNCPSESEGPAPAACAPKYAKRQRGSSLSNLADSARDVPQGSLRLAGTGPTRTAAAGLTSSACSRPNGESPPAPHAAPSGLVQLAQPPAPQAPRSDMPGCPDRAPNTRIWTAHVLTGIQPSAAQIGGSASVLPEVARHSE